MEGDATTREGCEGIVGSLICDVGGSEGSEGVGDGVREDVDENVETRRECVILFVDVWRIIEISFEHWGRLIAVTYGWVV